MSVKHNWLTRGFSVGVLASLMIVPLMPAKSSRAGERPTFNRTCDPRPDILPYHHHPEYRRTYNRPRFWSGWIANAIAPTSQEAMVWSENVQAGVYEYRNHPPRFKRYYGPKPWEAMQIGARPDFAKSSVIDVPTEQERAPVQADIQEAPPIDTQENTDGNAEVDSPSDIPPPSESLTPVPAPTEALRL